MAVTGRKPDKLTGQEIAYCYEHVANGGNGTEACRLAGYKGNDNVLGVQSTRLLKKAKIRKKIAKLREKLLKPTEMRAERVMHNLALLANQKASDFIKITDAGDTEVIPFEKMNGKDAAIKSIEIEKFDLMTGAAPTEDTGVLKTKIKIQLRDNIKPNEILAKHYNLISDNVDHSFPGGEFGNTKEVDVSGLSTKELKVFRDLQKKIESK